LWALVGIRLLCPFQLETTFSLAPNAQVVSIEAGAVTSQVHRVLRRLLLRNCDTLKIIFCKIPVCRVV
jgi:methyl coenzyme M reductase subunit C